MPSLRPGQTLRCLDSHSICRIDTLIGDGGQGEVYRVMLDGHAYALKWYNDLVLRVDRGLRARLQTAIDHGAPSPCFLWPFELVTLPDGSRLGYLMRLRRPGYVKVHSVLAEECQPSFRVLAMLGWQLTDALLALHGKGLVYQDLNAGNVFFDPDSGQIEICDNDNVDVDGAPSVMGGVWEFQAPEVVLRRAGPSRATDLHSLAVMLFRLLHIGHPLIGRCELGYHNLTDHAVLQRIYGSEARFVYDPLDESNRPLPDRHGPVIGHWAIYPESLRRLFVRAFTEGLYDATHGRVQETEWRSAFRQLHDAVASCPHCGAENFYDPDRLVRRMPHFECWCCSAELRCAPARMGIRRRDARLSEAPRHVIVLGEGARLFTHHLFERHDQSTTIAELRTDGTRRILRNQSMSTWQVSRSATSVAVPAETIGPGQSVDISDGLRIHFGHAVGEVKL